jgi:hypothetical protein
VCAYAHIGVGCLLGQSENSGHAVRAHRYDHVEDRHSYGMTDGPVYRDIDNPNAALFHIHVENLDRAMQWFRTDTFKEATKRATVVGRDFYLAEKQQPRPQA